jgi:hypothetical protein
MSSPRPSLNSSGHRCRYHCHWRRPDSFRGSRNVGRYWLQHYRARCWYVPSRLTIEGTSKPLEPIGSIAATLQAGIGANVAAGSLFAVAQSVAMGGGIPAAISAVGGLGAGAAGAAVAAVVI